MGENVENKHMVAIIKSKFPTEINLKLDEFQKGQWTVHILCMKIRRLIVAREKSEEIWKYYQMNAN